jgi:integrase
MSHNMALTQASRSAFAAPGHLTLADLIGQVEAASELPKSTRQNWCWALRTVARMAGKVPSAIPAHPEFLRRLLEKAAPLAMGLGTGAWNNARSLSGKAMTWAGLIDIPGRYLAPLGPQWRKLWPLLPKDSALAVQLSRLFHYCTANGIQPEDLDDEVMRRFYDALRDESLVQDPYGIYRGAPKSWNNAITRFAGWPGTLLAVPSKRGEVFSLPWADFPASLHSQIETHLASMGAINLDSDFHRPMRAATIKARRRQLRWFASALVHGGVEPCSLDRLEVLLAPQMAKRGLEYLLERRDGQSYRALANLAQYLPALARRIGLPAETIYKLKQYKQRLKIEHHGMAERHLPTLRRFDDPAVVDALLALPQRLRREAEGVRPKGARAAKLLQTAVAIELLLMAPVRISNLASIEESRHFVEVRTKPRQVHLQFPAEEVKNYQALEFPLPADTMELVDLYLRDYRHLLAVDPGDFLFPGKRAGCSKGGKSLSQQINRTVYKYTGLEMPAHRFRHAVGKIFLDRNPGQYEVVRQLLGHKNIKTTIEFYAGAEGAAAARHYSATILKLRDRKAGGGDGA